MGSTIRLITSVGIHRYSEAHYGWEGGIVSSPYVSVALIRLLGLPKGRATVLLTQAAAEIHQAPLEQALAETGWTAEFCFVPEGGTEDDQMETAAKVMNAVQSGEEILLDVTQGLRHFPFAYLAALTYLIGLQGNRLRGIYYGAYELRKKSPEGVEVTPIYELTSLFRLLEWYQALGAAKETGDLRPVARSLGRDSGRLFQQGHSPEEFGRASHRIEQLAKALALGAPLEVGIEVRRAVEALDGLHAEHVPWLPAQRVLEWLKEELLAGRWGRLLSTPSEGRRLKKGDIPLTREELTRQLEIVQWYAEQNDFSKTLLLLREWLVSAAVWAYGEPSRWLEQPERTHAERRLHALERQLEEGLAIPEQAVLGHLWQRLRKLRNTLAHAGMSEEELRLNRPEQLAAQYLKECRAALDQIAEGMAWPLPRKGRLVITPLGLMPGLLYSVCRQLDPNRLLIVTSQEAVGAIDEAIAKAGRTDVEWRPLLLQDPFGDVDALKRLLDQQVREWLASAEEVVANVTGGTSFMGYLVQQLADEASRFGHSVRSCVLIDRRPAHEQRTNPYVEGEVRWLKSREEDEEAADGEVAATKE